jgi:DNA adenine methylase
VVILCDDACNVIRQQDGEHTLYYCDPPYVHTSRTAIGAYQFEMDIEQHKQLLETLAGIRGKFLLSGYPSAIYDDFAARQGWRRTDKMIDNKASNSKTKDIMCECLWMNF